jgi:septal ring factor EnvC (AmiA/AmiB activator)
MVESEFERLGRTVTQMVERFSKLKDERIDLVARLEQSEKTILDLRRQLEELSNRKSQAKGKLDGLISRLEKLDF